MIGALAVFGGSSDYLFVDMLDIAFNQYGAWSWFTIAAAAAAGIAAFLVLRGRNQLPYPPGPKGVPLIGNLRDLGDLSSGPQYITFAEWSRKFKSDIIHLQIFRKHLMIVNSLNVASELFEKRSGIYSDRPRIPMLELAGMAQSTVILPYGKQLMFHRRLFHKYLSARVLHNFESQLLKATHELLRRLVDTPGDFMDHIRLMAASLIISVAYGMDVQSADDPYVSSAREVAKYVTIGVQPGRFLVNDLPLLRYVPEWVPGGGFKRVAKEARKFARFMVEAPLQYVRDQMANGGHIKSVASTCLEDLGTIDSEMEEGIREATASMYGGGSDTTVSVLCSFILAMVLHPEAVRKAQEELDRVIGQHRLPKYSDKLALPYVGALVKESLRWNPVATLAARRITVDDIYDGKFIPAGTVMMANIWAMLHNETDFPEPEKFNPDRFLKNGELDPDVRSPEDAAFGFGRRACAGKDFALSSLFINIASILFAFNIGKAIGEDGNAITPNAEYTIGVLVHPVPFKCSITPRSPQALALITEAHALHHPS